MKRLILFHLTFFILHSSLAHPGVGIVKDSKGNIYYTDLNQIWKIKPDGTKSVVIRGVHSHEIAIDPEDNLYGEHLWYNGESAGTWGHYAWRLNSNGKLDTLIGPKEGYLDNYSFNRDGAGNMYWIQQWKPNRIKKLTPDGKLIILAEKEMGEIGWMHVTSDGRIYFTDHKDLYQLDQSGKIHLLARNPGAVNTSKSSLWGIWTDRSENIYIANMDQGKVVKIDSSGKISTLIASSADWFPLSGVFDDKDNLWLMEGNKVNEVRVRKILSKELASEPKTSKVVFGNSVFIGSLLLALVVLLIYAYYKKKHTTIFFANAL